MEKYDIQSSEKWILYSTLVSHSLHCIKQKCKAETTWHLKILVSVQVIFKLIRTFFLTLHTMDTRTQIWVYAYMANIAVQHDLLFTLLI